MRISRSVIIAVSAILIAVLRVNVLAQLPRPVVTVTVLDEVGAPVPGAQVTFLQDGKPQLDLQTDFAGRVKYVLWSEAPYRLRISKPGFYQRLLDEAQSQGSLVMVVLNHEQMLTQQVSVTASVPGIDPAQLSNKSTMNLPEIINVPYPTSRDIRNLLPFYPGVAQDESGQVHVAGSETWAALDLLDGFDIRSPVSGLLALRVSADAVRSIDVESTRYPVEFGRSTGGVIALYTGMGDNKFRFNVTDFLPSFRDANGIKFDKFVPRLTFSGPLVQNRAWFFDGLEVEYDNNYVQELPENADTNHVIRGSNLLKFQVNATPESIVSGGLLVNAYHSPHDGLSPLVPQESTVKRNTIVWMPYVRDQHSFHNGALLDVGLGVVRIGDGFEPQGDAPFEITPELYLGSYFQTLSGHSQRIEGNAIFYMPSRHWKGQHDLRFGVDLNHIGYSFAESLAPVNYLREDGTLLRQSTFPTIPMYTRHNFEVGAFAQDRWTLRKGLLIEPGLRFDWDEVIEEPLFSPRIAATYSPTRLEGRTKVSAGVGLYYDHTQLEYLTRAFVSRMDQYFGGDGVTPVGPTLATTFSANYGRLHEARALNWSVSLEQRLPGAVFLRANVMQKTVHHEFAYVNESDPGGLSGSYQLTPSREDHDDLFEVDARRTFSHGYTLFGAYTHSTAHTNAAIDYQPTISLFGTQQSAPLEWDTPSHVLSWGWLPLLLPYFRKSWDFVYTLDWRDGFPYTSYDANYRVIGQANGRRFPDYVSFSPGLEWRVHLRGAYFGLRGVIENIADSSNPAVVNSCVNSPQYGTFSEFQGRAITARIRLINSGK
jgi:hypothetical protein